jgi:PAS domain S-box-containing protein
VTEHRWRDTAYVFALIVVVGIANIVLEDTAEGRLYMLPGGLLASLAVITPRRHRVVAVLAGAVVAAAPLVIAFDHPGSTCLYLLALSVGGVVVADLLHPDAWPGDGTAVVEVLKLMLSCVVGAVVAALLVGAAAAVTPDGLLWWRVAVGTAVTQLLHMLVIVPLFLPSVQRQGRPAARWFEPEARWLVLVVVSVFAVSPVSVPNGAMLVLPVLVWTALRAPIWEICVQVIWVYGVVIVSESLDPESLAVVTGVHEAGSFAQIAPRLFVLSCAIATIPFAIMVALERRSSARANAAQNWNNRLLESVRGTCIIGIDQRGRIGSFNPGAERILGYRAEDVIGKNPSVLHSEAEIRRLAERFGCEPTHRAVVEAVREQSVHSAVDIVFLRADGEPRILSMVLQPVYDAEQRILGWVGTAEDVTERVHTQEALEEALRIESSAAERLRGVERAKDSFVSTVSHEIRTPMTNIVGYLELLLDESYGPMSSDQVGVLNRMAHNSDRLLSLIDDLLARSSVDTLVGGMAHEQLDLRTVVRDAEEIFRPGLFGRELSLDVQTPPHPVCTVGDPRLLERMVTNLVSNAIKFTPDGGRVTVSLGDVAGSWRLSVSDTGIGIPDDEQEMLFQRFYRATTAQDAAIQGSGLGLNIAHTIAELHDATIEVESTVGKGSTFVVKPV